jgi:alpha-beta hydrolase superfamily lysophospholipase
MRRKQRLSPLDRDRLIRDYEHAACAAYDAEPVEVLLDGPEVGAARSVRVLTFNRSAAGTPVILLHGIASVSVLAAPLLPYLRDRPVYAVDWPGHGLSGPSVLSPGTSFRTHAVSVIRSLIEQIGAEQVDLVGHSLGAQISLYSGLDLGRWVRRIVLLGAPGASFQATRPLPVMKLLAIPKLGETLLRIPLSRRTFASNNDMALGKGALDQLPPELVEAAFLLAGRRSNASSIASFFRALVRRGSIRAGVSLEPADLGRVLQPILMCWGDEDVFLTPMQGAASIASFRDVRLVRISGAGHAPWLQATDVVGRAIVDHLGIGVVSSSPAEPPLQRAGTSTTVHLPSSTRRTSMTKPDRISFPSDDDLSIAAYRWLPEGEPRAIVQIAHGVGEYALRYAPLAEALTDRGFVVYAHDHRGHGATLRDEDTPGELGAGGWKQLVADIGLMGDAARAEHPGLRLGLVAHSLGSFATQQFLLDNSERVDAVALSGTASIDLLEPALDLDAPMDLAMFNAAFEPARTGFDWLSRDEDQVDKYIADPGCGFGLDIPGGKDMFVEARQLADPDRVANMRNDLPVYVTVGDMDPVNGQLALVNVLVDRYEAAGLTDVTQRVYEGARHEVFNETNRDEVFGDLGDWLEKKLA